MSTSTPPERDTNDQACYPAPIFNADSGQVYINRLTEPLEDAVSVAAILTAAPTSRLVVRQAMRPWQGRVQAQKP